MFKKSLPLITRHLNLTFSVIRATKTSQLSNKCLDLRSSSILIQKSILTQILVSRNYAKGKDIKKTKKKKVHINENELAEIFDVEKLYMELNKPLDSFKNDLTQYATLRTTQGAIENIKINFEGQTYVIQDLAEIGRKNPKLYVLDFSSFPQTVETVVKTLQESELNLNVQQEGHKIYIPVPKVTKEHRELLAKKCKAFYQKCRDSIRDVQLRYVKNLKNKEKLSEEMKYSVTDQLNALGDKQINIAEDILKQKQEELLKSD